MAGGLAMTSYATAAHLSLLLLLFTAAPRGTVGEGSAWTRANPSQEYSGVAAAEIPLAPVRDLGPSLAASAAQGTAVAVLAEGADGRDDGDGCAEEFSATECAVILTRSPAPAGGASSNLTAAAALLPPLPPPLTPPLTPLNRGPAPLPPPSGPPSRSLHVLHERSGLACAVTGLASDARHLVRVAARAVSDHEYVYGGSSAPSVHDVVRDALAGAARDAALESGGRPFGVQALVVGNRAPGRGGATTPGGGGEGNGRWLRLYTVDPAGGWRHWGGGGTAVGKNADVARRGIGAALLRPSGEGEDKVVEGEDADESDNAGPPRGWRKALDVAMQAVVEATEEEEGTQTGGGGVANEEIGGQYDAVVVFGGPRGAALLAQSRCFAVHPDLVASSYLRCKQSIAESKQKRSAAI